MMDLATPLPDSPVPHLLRTNAPLPEHLAAQVKATFTPVQADITELDVRISRLSAVLDQLVQKRGQLHEYLDQHRALFAPARRVPPEIWGEIFQHCLSSDAAVEDLRCTRAIVEDRFSSASSDAAAAVVDDNDHRDESERRAPWVFTRVSRTLRLAALSCPPLWTRVSVCVDDHAVLDRRKLWPLAQVLRLSGSLPLSVTLFGRSYDPNAFEVWTHSPAAQRLAATCPRWEKLQLSHVPCPTVNGFFSALRNRLDTLEVLEMHFTSELPRTGKPLACDVFANAPRLRALTVTGAAFPYDALHLPMRQLASCSMHSVLYFPRLVQSCPDLVHLNLTLPAPGVRVESFGVLRCERVRSLRLDLHTSDRLLTDQLLKSLVLPALTTLHIECHHLPGDGAAEFFKKNNTITHLTFRVDKWSEESLLRSLQSLPLLEHLCVSIWPGSMKDTELLLNNLARRGRSVEPMLPRLQEIELVCRAADFPVETFVRLVRARWAFGRRGNETEGGVLVSPLKSVNVFLHGSDVADHVSATLSKLKDLKAAGLDIRAYAKGLLMSGLGRRIL